MDRQTTYGELETIYSDLKRELDELQPGCQLSSRCCKFKEYDHELWTTRLEFEYLVEHEGKPQSAPDGVCPYLKHGLCGVRDHRMLGCRVFYCDEAYKPVMNSVYEKYHRKMKDLHERAGIPNEYSEFLKLVQQA